VTLQTEPEQAEHYYNPQAILADYRILAETHQGTETGERFQRLAAGLQADHTSPAIPLTQAAIDAIRAGIVANYGAIRVLQKANVEANETLTANKRLIASMKRQPGELSPYEKSLATRKQKKQKAQSNG
jgi:hypothetical protein